MKEGDWAGLDQQIIALGNAGDLGEALFGATISPMIARKVADTVTGGIAGYQKTAREVGQVEFDEMCGKIVDNVQNLQGIDLLKQKRKVTIKYRSSSLHEVEVDNVLEEVEAKVAAWLKGVAIQSGLLKALEVEELLGIHDLEAATKVVIKPKLVKRWSASRSRFATLMKSRGTATADEMQQLSKSSSPSLTLEDPTWKVEKGVMAQLTGTAAELRAKQKIVDWFPSKERYADITDVLNLVTAELNRAAIGYVPVDVRDGLTLVQGWLTALKTGQDLKLSSAKMVPLCQEAAVRLPFFLRCMNGIVALKGQDAMDHLCHVLCEKAAKNTATIADTTEIIRYKLVVPDRVKDEVNAAIEQVNKADKTKKGVTASVAAKAKLGAKASEGLKFAESLFLVVVSFCCRSCWPLGPGMILNLAVGRATGIWRWHDSKSCCCSCCCCCCCCCCC